MAYWQNKIFIVMPSHAKKSPPPLARRDQRKRKRKHVFKTLQFISSTGIFPKVHGPGNDRKMFSTIKKLFQ